MDLIFGIFICVFLIMAVYYSDVNKRMFIICLAISGMLLSGCGYGMYTSAVDKKTYQTDWKAPIEALQDNRDIHGQLYLRRGYIDQTLYYYYIVNTAKGKMVYKVASDYTYLDDTLQPDGEKPSIECGSYKFETPNPVRDFLVAGLMIWKQECTLRIPKGAVTDEYKVDMQ